MKYDFTKNEVIKVIQIYRNQVSFTLLEMIFAWVSPTFSDNDLQGEDMFSIERIKEEHEYGDIPFEDFKDEIEAIQEAGRVLEAGYVQFI